MTLVHVPLAEVAGARPLEHLGALWESGGWGCGSTCWGAGVVASSGQAVAVGCADGSAVVVSVSDADCAAGTVNALADLRLSSGDRCAAPPRLAPAGTGSPADIVSAQQPVALAPVMRRPDFRQQGSTVAYRRGGGRAGHGAALRRMPQLGDHLPAARDALRRTRRHQRQTPWPTTGRHRRRAGRCPDRAAAARGPGLTLTTQPLQNARDDSRNDALGRGGRPNDADQSGDRWRALGDRCPRHRRRRPPPAAIHAMPLRRKFDRSLTEG